MTERRRARPFSYQQHLFRDSTFSVLFCVSFAKELVRGNNGGIGIGIESNLISWGKGNGRGAKVGGGRFALPVRFWRVSLAALRLAPAG